MDRPCVGENVTRKDLGENEFIYKEKATIPDRRCVSEIFTYLCPMDQPNEKQENHCAHCREDDSADDSGSG